MENYKLKIKNFLEISIGDPKPYDVINLGEGFYDYLIKAKYEDASASFCKAERFPIDVDLRWDMEELEYTLFEDDDEFENIILRYPHVFELIVSKNDKGELFGKIWLYLQDYNDHIEIIINKDDLVNFYYYLNLVINNDTNNEKIKELLDSKIIVDDSMYYIVHVCFYDGGKEYAYICNDESIEEDDYVIVSVGESNEKKSARVVKADYYRKQDLDFDVDKMKKVIGLVTEVEEILEDYDFDSE